MTLTPTPADGPLDPALLAAIAEVAAHPRVLVALDFDGTLAPERDDPAQARALPAAREALLRLRALPGVTIALISGRSLASLTAVAELPDDVPLVGSHGLEVQFARGDARAVISESDRERVRTLHSWLEPLVAATAGAWLELKPAGLAVHSRLVAASAASVLADQVRAAALATDPALMVREGKNVVEFAVRDVTKGDGLRALRERFAPDAVVMAGDDVTDDDALRELGPHDLGIAVGPRPTAGQFRVADPAELALVVQRLVALREALGIAR